MFDIGMSELMLIGIVALIVVGPKDLPGLFHTLGRFTAKARSLGREFNRAMNDAAKESGVEDVAKGLKGVANPKKFGLDKLNDAAERFESWKPGEGGEKKDAPRGKIDDERAADIAKIREATEKMGQSKLDREAAAQKAAEKAGEKAAMTTGGATPARSAKAPAKKPAAKKPAAKTAAATKTAAKKAAAKTAAAAKKPAVAKTAAAKNAAPKAAKVAKAPPKAAKAPPKKAKSE